MTGRLAGKTALITGGSRGIGLAIARLFAAEGASLILSASSPDSLVKVGQEFPSSHCIAADLTDLTEVEGLFAAAEQQVGNIDILVNNAGVYMGKPFENYTMAELDRLMQINVIAVFRLTQLAVTHMKAQGACKIINLSSTAGKWESPHQAAYNTTKHAVVGMSKCVALETARLGINVNTICPGMVETDMFQEFEVHAEAQGISLEDLKAGAVARIPQGRFLQPEEVAHIAVYLASNESDGMTGQTITISGGMRMG